ncbi:MAG: hypothetical protein AAGM16_10250 [Pseudomonadota bacterium]
MELLQELVESGRIVDIMLVVIVLEIAALIGYRVVTGKGLSVPSIILNVGAGGSLMVALKLLYDGVGWQLIAAALVASLLFHTGDLVYRWRQTGGATR